MLGQSDRILGSGLASHPAVGGGGSNTPSCFMLEDPTETGAVAGNLMLFVLPFFAIFLAGPQA